MRRIIVASVICGLLTSGLMATAQKSSEMKFKLGVKGGINIAKFKVSDEGSTKSKSLTGFIIGSYAQIPLNKQFEIQPELFYGQYGTKAATTSLTIDYKLNYLVLPVLVKYKFSYTGVSLALGPQYSTLLSAKILGVDIKKLFKNDDFSGV